MITVQKFHAKRRDAEMLSSASVVLLTEAAFCPNQNDLGDGINTGSPRKKQDSEELEKASLH